MLKTRTDMEVIIWAKRIMAQHGLSHWSFKINGRFKNTLGKCSYSNKMIQLQRAHVEEDTYECILDTLMHEIAHALVGHAAGHGPTWQRKAVELGCAPTTTKTRIRDVVLVKDERVFAFFLPTSKGEIFQCILPETMYNEIQSGKRKIENMYITRRKAYTKGRLVIREITTHELALLGAK